MKQLLFLLLFPCLAMAQYSGNGNQKITLGEQTTADGLVYRGVASIDTVTATSKITRANKQDTSAYILLDTVTNLLWHYKIGSNAWTQAGGGVSVSSFSAGTTGLTPSTATTGAVTLGGTLAVANGGTNTGTLTANKVMVGNGTSGVLTPTNLHWDNTNSRLGIGILNPTNPFEVLRKNNSWVSFKDTLTGGFFAISNGTGSSSITYPYFNIQGAGNFGSNLQYTAAFVAAKDSLSSENTGDILWYFDARKRKSNPLGSITKVLSGTTYFFGNFGDPQLVIKADDKVGIGTDNPSEKLHVVGNARISGLANAANPVNVQVDVNGVLVRTSSIDIKEDVQSLPYGLNEVMLLQPSKFSYIDKYKYGEGYDIGFIAQDVNNVIPEAVGTGIESDIFMDSVKLIPVLTKAIQEQTIIIKQLEQRILNLENK